jgi:hypothetical protein
MLGHYLRGVTKMKRTMLLKYSILLVLITSIFLSGCASTQKLSTADRKKIEAVYINTNVEKVMYYNFGPADNKILETFAEQNNIFIDKIVVEELNTALRQSGKIPVADSASQSSATLNISFIMYGFSKPDLISSTLVPIASIKCSMIDLSGKIIWSASDRVSSIRFSNPAEPMTLDEMKNNPKLIENAWRAATKKVVANIVKEL